MQVKSIAECEHFAILSTFIKVPVVIKIFVLSILSGHFTQVLLYFVLGEKRKLDASFNPDPVAQLVVSLIADQGVVMGAQWLSGRVLYLRLRGRGF